MFNNKIKLLALPLISLSAMVSTQSNASCDVNVFNNWNTGFIAQITLVNDSEQTMQDWNAQLSLENGFIQSYWGDGSAVGQNPVDVVNASWEQPVLVGQSKNLYIVAQTGNNSLVSDLELTSSFCPQEEETAFTLSKFDVKYFAENDGLQSGQGTDGFDPAITQTLIAQDVVDYMAIDYSYSNFHNIDSHEFYASWEGVINVADASLPIDMNIDVSWSNINVYLDGQLIESYFGHKKRIELNLSEGEHDIRLDYHNHWHTSGINVTFTQNENTTAEEVAELLTQFDAKNAKIVTVAGYESSDLYNEINITVNYTAQPVILFLSTYHSLNYVLDIADNANIQAVFVNSYAPTSSVSGIDSNKIFYSNDLEYAYNTDALEMQAADLAQLPVTQIQAIKKYSLNNVAVD
ncbi:cellulose binding domain-containing protein [Marinicellulosiphila megalodicopiae]|uniref:cellulose binding domain-containing protein n=1 Tax=Marinicellulosiphila megalodicopiae TaxID=2724896 RepID=UPI003BAF85A5